MIKNSKQVTAKDSGSCNLHTEVCHNTGLMPQIIVNGHIITNNIYYHVTYAKHCSKYFIHICLFKHLQFYSYSPDKG